MPDAGAMANEDDHAGAVEIVEIGDHHVPHEESEQKLMETSVAESYETRKRRKMGKIAYAWLRAQETGVVKTVVWIFLAMMYQVIGAWIYIAIEGEYDHVKRLKKYHHKIDVLRNRTDWQDRIVDVVTDRTGGGLQANALRDLMIDYEQSMGLEVIQPILPPESWSWLNAVFFCCSLYTSIGFGGRLFPRTTAGRVMTMIYSFIGFPFFMTMTGDLGLVVFEGIYVLWWKYTSYVRSREEDDYTEEELRAFLTSEYREYYKKLIETFPITLGIMLSIISLAGSSGAAQLFEPTWDYFTANYYFVTSFLTIGLGDVSPSAPKGAPAWTLIPHILLLIISTTFIGLCQHAMSRRIELAYVHIGYAIHMEFRTRQVEPDISTMKSKQSPVSEEAQINLLARKLGSAESFFYGMMDSSRRKLLLETWHKKANMECVEVQTNLPKREVGCQHLMNVEGNDVYCYGDDLGETPPPPPKPEEPDLRSYVYKIVD